MTRPALATSSAFLSAVGALAIVTVFSTPAAIANPLAAQCVDPHSGELRVNAVNDDFCRCFDFVRDPMTKRFVVRSENGNGQCNGDPVTLSRVEKKADTNTPGAPNPSDPSAPTPTAVMPDTAGFNPQVNAPTASNPSTAKTPTVTAQETRPGHGYGDDNHIHTGPPGLNAKGGEPPGLSDKGGVPPGQQGKGGDAGGQGGKGGNGQGQSKK